MWALLHNRVYTVNQGLGDFEVSWSPGLVLDPPFRGGFDANLVDHETSSIACHVGLHVGFSDFLGPSGPQAVV
jgi:hypothetical protein